MVSEKYQQEKRRVEVRYSALPRWFPVLFALVCLLSGGAWLALFTGGLPDLSGVRHSLQRLDTSIEASSISPVRQADFDRSFHHDSRLQMLLPGDTPQERTLFLLMTVCLLSGLLWLVGRDTKLSFNREGLRFPTSMMPELNLRRQRQWNDLSAITIKSDVKAQSRHLQLYFQSGGRATINIDAMSRKDLENLLLCLDEWASQCAMSPDLVALHHQIFNEQKSYTSMWEEEMASHFSSTNFVALAAGTLLQSARLKIVMHAFSGGLSAVYLAEQTGEASAGKPGIPATGGNVVVVKESVIPPTADEATARKAREMFKREAHLLMQLKHDRIAQVLDHFVENGRDYLVLEYIPGLTLRQYIRRHGRQSEEAVLEFTAQIAEILVYLHNRETPILHRDITPDNLIVTPDGKLYLIDFGAANQFVGAATGTIVGKQLYISPEQFRGKAVPASDIYSLGATMHYLLTGQEPEALCQSDPQKVCEDISTPVRDLVLISTQQQTEDRLQSAESLLKIIRTLQDTSAAAPEILVANDKLDDSVVVKVRQYEGQTQ